MGGFRWVIMCSMNNTNLTNVDSNYKLIKMCSFRAVQAAINRLGSVYNDNIYYVSVYMNSNLKPQCMKNCKYCHNWERAHVKVVFARRYLQRSGRARSGWVAGCQSRRASCRRWCNSQGGLQPLQKSSRLGWGRCGWPALPPHPATARSGSAPSLYLPPETESKRHDQFS